MNKIHFGSHLFIILLLFLFFLLFPLSSISMHVCSVMCLHVHMCKGNHRCMLGTFLVCSLPFPLETLTLSKPNTHQFGRIFWLVSSGYLPVSAFPVLGLQACTAIPINLWVDMANILWLSNVLGTLIIFSKSEKKETWLLIKTFC